MIKDNMMKKRLLIISIIFAVSIILFFRLICLAFFKVPSKGMYPTLKPGDRIVVNKLAYVRKPPQIGDIVVFLSPIEKKKYLVKRYIASDGERIQIKNGEIFVNGNTVEILPIKNVFYYNRGEYGSEKPVEIPKGFFYALGDNSANSMDSRYWGFVPEKNIRGKVVVVKRMGVGMKWID